MSYRVEIAKQGRAGCQNTACKAEGIKIQKGEFRFGTWVEMEHGASFRWKHWGCVSGFQMQNLREFLKQGDPDGEYQWDFMDGLNEVPEEYQEKLKTAVIKGKIADEDWKGDPAYNELGQKGTQPRAKKAKKPAEGEDEDADGAASAPTPKKRRRGKKAEDSDEEDAKPAPKRAKKAKKEEAEADSKPAPKKEPVLKKERRKRATSKEDSDEDEVMPTRTSRSRRSTKKEESADELGIEDEAKLSVEDKPAKKSRAKKVKQEAVNENGAAVEDEVRNGRANGTKQELKEELAGIKPEPEEDGVVDMPDKATKPRAKKAKRESIKKEERDDSAVASQVKNEDEDVVDLKPKRERRVKKEEAPEVNTEDVDGHAEAEEEEMRGKKRAKAELTEEVSRCEDANKT
ncbi:serine/threonine-protein kinase M1 [Pseudogymnoascus destructans]|uniref:PARP-type domain-containing protein n=2 Tax=Pseudogymnoascus destructans TaxID=655981 RepID=L8G2S7_PSED2|nr:serine/threonine-protein kinase M1 [Pseudogymnoascus destructans]ELR07089.1 hypothetical protein GMDG_08266 [Pseudogymnoascus destructans 20631-21]OAF58532.1 serine/threonine-protein kinase M1 [Pseudogymnoascus destructans]